MNGSDVIKLILIMHGYDRDINIETWKDCEDITVTWYDWTAYNSKRDEISGEEPGLSAALCTIFSTLYREKYNCPPDWIGSSIKDLLNDNYRNIIIKRNQEIEIYNSIRSEISKPLDEWAAENNPCPNCEINNHKHWDDIHYNCELCHTQSCDIMKSFWEEYKDKLDIINKNVNEVFEQRMKNSKLVM